MEGSRNSLVLSAVSMFPRQMGHALREPWQSSHEATCPHGIERMHFSLHLQTTHSLLSGTVLAATGAAAALSILDTVTPAICGRLRP